MCSELWRCTTPVISTGSATMFRTGLFTGLLSFNNSTTTEIYTLSLHDALPIAAQDFASNSSTGTVTITNDTTAPRSEEHTSELQSQFHLVCRVLLEKKNIPAW